MIRWGKALVAACHDFRDADGLLDEMLIRVELSWARVSNQLEITRELEATMSSDDRDLQERILFVLRGKLETTVRKLLKLAARPVLSIWSKLKFVMCKDALTETIVELESWQRLYEPSWFHLIKLAPPKIEVTLKQIVNVSTAETTQSHKVAKKFREAFNEPTSEVGQQKSSSTSTKSYSAFAFISESSLSDCKIQEIPFCSATFAHRPEGNKHLIIDSITSGAVQESDAIEFARRFEHADPFVFGLLSCKGVVRKRSRKNAMSFLFNVPTDYTVVWGLRQLLLGGTSHDSLSGRLEVARSLVTAVYYIHLYGFVHKNIRPETILTLARSQDTGTPSKAFLVGFQVIRNADGATYPVSDSTGWEKNLYRHPLRQGANVEYYVMQHDMYSLGVCLLEIGLWSSFITYGPHWAAQPSPALGLPPDLKELKDPFALKDHLVALSRSSTLRSKMGTRYGEVIETCLTCLDKDNLNFGDEKEFAEEKTAGVGTRYLDKVLGVINSLSV